MMEVAVFLVVVIVLAAWELADEGNSGEPDPLDLARPSVERLDREAERAMAELRKLDQDGWGG